MKFLTTLTFTVMSLFIYAQNVHFKQRGEVAPNPTVVNDFSAWADGFIHEFDFDNDGDIDLLQTELYQGIKRTCLLRNDGAGNFIRVQEDQIDQFHQSSADIGDIDGDNDFDIIIIGWSASANGVAVKLYRNDCGVFNEVLNTPFVPTRYGDVVFGDIDNDNDLDVVISGINSSSTIDSTRIYKNDGTGLFTYYNGDMIAKVADGTLEFADIDNDNDLDLLITGDNITDEITKLYLNDGTGVFTLSPGTPFAGVKNSATLFVDYDNDNDLDLFLMGHYYVGASLIKHTDLYANDGSGNFSVVPNTFPHVAHGHFQVEDVDNDNDLDVVIVGTNNSGQYCQIFNNDGVGGYNFSQSFEWWSGRAMTLADIDNDNDFDLITISDRLFNLVYLNDGLGNFSGTNGSVFEGMAYGNTELADVDGDLDLDLFVNGNRYVGNGVQNYSQLYINDGVGNYSLMGGTPFATVSSGDMKFADIDGDNDQDIFLTGKPSGLPIAKMYLNDGLGNYTEMTGTPFIGVFSSGCDFADVDNDNDLDLIVSGENQSGNRITNLYLNDGSGNYTVDATNNFVGVRRANIMFFDFNSDSDYDLIITGQNSSNQATTKVYENNGSGVFIEVPTSIMNLFSTSLDFADIDGDNDMDIFISGELTDHDPHVQLYLNDGLGSFSAIASGVENIYRGQMKFEDIDNDSDQDIIITGSIYAAGDQAKIYLNDGTGNFTEQNNLPLFENSNGSISIGELTGDNLLDIILMGEGDTYRMTRLYEQTTCSASYSNISLISCDEFISPQGYTYSTSGTYTEIITNGGGCDSVITYCITVLGSTNPINISEVTCDMYTSPSGITYTTSGIYNDTISNVFGCDSIIVIDLTVNNGTTSNLVETSCGPYTSPSGAIYSLSGNYVDIISNVVGCDSTINITLTINNIDIATSQNGMEITSNQGGATYQWVDCLNGFAPLNGEINQSLIAPNQGEYAVEVTVNGCTDTSDCVVINNIGLEEFSGGERTLIKIVDLLGRETPKKPNTTLIYIYSDGTIERVFGME